MKYPIITLDKENTGEDLVRKKMFQEGAVIKRNQVI